MDTTNHLRDSIGNTALNMNQRTTAAEHLVGLLMAAVPTPADDDAEVTKLQQPWDCDPEIAAMWAKETNGYSVNGRSLPEAKAAALRQRKRALLVSLAEDVNEDALVRAAAKALIGGASRQVRD